MDNIQNNLILVPGKLYLAICPLAFSVERGGQLKLNEVYLLIDSHEVFSVFNDVLIEHREYHFLNNNKVIKPRLNAEKLSKYFMEI